MGATKNVSPAHQPFSSDISKSSAVSCSPSMIQSVCSCQGSYQEEPNVLEVGDDMLGSGNWRLRAHGTSERCAPKVP